MTFEAARSCCPQVRGVAGIQNVAAASPPPVVIDERPSPGTVTLQECSFGLGSPPGTAALQFGVARLKRLDEVYSDHPVYFVTACTHERRELLA